MSEPSSTAVTAARRVDADWSPERSEYNLLRVHARRVKAARVVRLSTLAVAAGLLLSLGIWSSFRGKSAGETARRVSAPQVTPSVLGAKSPRTTFADGSVARVSDGGELSVTSASQERIESKLVHGAADFEVTKHAERDFVVVAGQVRVRVVGTRFRVELLGERTRVSVTEGKVEVQDGAEKSYLEAGESRFFPSAPSVAPAEPSAPSATPVVVAGRARFLELARGGKYKDAYQVMSQSPSVVGSSAEDLMLAADAARLSNHPEQALGFLRRVTAEHRADSRAPLAAFISGRVLFSQLGRPAEAGDAYALSRRLRPAGALAEDALAREAEASAAAGALPRAESLARQYLGRYPSGKHRQTMQRLAPSP